MQNYEYRVIAAPARGVKAKGIKSNEARFAHALEELMNRMAEDGWEYQRAETLPSIERSGLTSTTTTWRNVLVFRKPSDAVDTAETVEPPLALVAPEPEVEAKPVFAPAPRVTTPQSPEDDASESEGASRMLKDNGVEELSEVSGVSSSLKQLAENRRSGQPDE